MRVIGEGHKLRRVEVVLWECESDDLTTSQLLSAVLRAASSTDDEVRGIRDVDRATSYDIQPPSGGVGVALWVRADDVGPAADTAWRVVRDAAATTFSDSPRLWDLRLIPRDAILSDTAAKTPLVE